MAENATADDLVRHATVLIVSITEVHVVVVKYVPLSCLCGFDFVKSLNYVTMRLRIHDTRQATIFYRTLFFFILLFSNHAKGCENLLHSFAI